MSNYIIPFFGGIILIIVSLVIVVKHDSLDENGKELMTKKRTWIAFPKGLALVLFSVLDFLLT